MANLDEQVTKSDDPKLLAARLFIGKLPSGRITKEELAKKFEKCGNVIGVSINSKGFGFVQYETEIEAQRAAKELQNVSMKGNNLDVKLAAIGKKTHGENESGSRKRRFFDDRQRREEMRRDRDDADRRNYGLRPAPFLSDLPPNVQFPPLMPSHMNDMAMMKPGGIPVNELPMMKPNMPLPPFMAQRPLSDGPPFQPENFRNDMFPPPVGLKPAPVPPVAPHPPEDRPSSAKKTEPGVERPFDAVIVVTQKTLKQYAEVVERRLLELNMVVDMIFLLNEKALNKAIDDMTRRGVLYIIVVQTQHEEHKSVTVNIMHGSPQEHRNMPLEDALIMLARNFNAYLSSLRCGSEQPTMGFLLNLLAEGKHLSVAELDRIIAHLQDRRDRMIEADGGRKDSSSSNSTVALQQKILSLVSSALLSNNPSNGPPQTCKIGSTSAAVSQPPATAMASLAQQFGINFNSQIPPPPVPNQTGAPQSLSVGQPPASTPHTQTAGAAKPSLNLSDPSLIKALDNLMQSPSLFKSLNQPPITTPQHRQQPPLLSSVGQSFAMPPRPPAAMGFGPAFGHK